MAQALAQALANVIEMTAQNKPAAATMPMRRGEFLQVDERSIGNAIAVRKWARPSGKKIFKADFLLEP